MNVDLSEGEWYKCRSTSWSSNIMNPDNVMQEVMMNGNIPVAAPGRAGMMSGGGGVIPPTLLEESRVPRFYHEAIVACGATSVSMLPHTALVYNLMVTSGLPRSVLSYVWSAVNRTLPGQLTRPEFFSCLALIALAQKGESLAALCTLSQLPIPYLQPVQIPNQPLPPPVVNTARPTASMPSRPPPTSVPRDQKSSFVPSSLMEPNGKPRSDMDLLGDVFKSPSASQSTNVPALLTLAEPKLIQQEVRVSGPPVPSSKPNYDLSDIDWGSVGSALTPSSETSNVTLDISGSTSNALCTGGNNSTVSRRNSRGDISDIWAEIVTAAAEKFSECDSILKSSSPSVLKELFETERGENYLRSLRMLHMIVSRIQRSASHGELSTGSLATIADCVRIWSRLDEYLEDDDTDETGISNAKCAICRQPVCSPVSFGGSSYHAECANLWVNCVRPLLPTPSIS